ncbi:hypothetical protein FGO68_gene4971 [Halteria grandinella]|uniref:Uncharacterized protein n=1 Tax=Halteria grandinella TaxID=5974 RepID=A0A8J8NN52_HALGN|nr:hypothetical protein FGO68_gene4971 [Halteria grandinella]
MKGQLIKNIWPQYLTSGNSLPMAPIYQNLTHQSESHHDDTESSGVVEAQLIHSYLQQGRICICWPILRLSGTKLSFQIAYSKREQSNSHPQSGKYSEVMMIQLSLQSKTTLRQNLLLP